MKLLSRLNLTHRVALTIAVVGILPALVISGLAIRTARSMADDIGHSFSDVAEGIGDKIDRNLFERYGDVQAFGANDVLLQKESWYQVGSDKNRIAAAANRYASLYGIYPLSLVIDLEGKVIAVNDKDPSGKPLDTAWLYQKNFKDTEWFREALAGNFLRSDSLSGTVVDDLHVEEDLRRIYGNEGLALGFSAPFRDAEGKVIGVWRNLANFDIVEGVIADAYGHLKEAGKPGADFQLIDRHGRVLVDYDPSGNGGRETFLHDLSVILKQNLVDSGLQAAREVAAGKTGFDRSIHPKKNHAEVVGFAPCDGELGFPGLKWGVLIRVPESEALAAMHAQVRQIVVVSGLSIAALVAIGLWLGRSIAQPLVVGISSIRDVGNQVAGAAGQFSTSSHAVAESASEQAASLEETSAALEEISAMTKRNADNSTSSKVLSQQARESATAGLDRLNEMGNTINTIKSAVGEMETAVSEMQSSSQEIAKIIKTIDEIAFQTNLLALNAAVEAARAGEAGMGFAVVADEVRALAQRSAQAAKDTSEKIEAAIKRSEFGGVASKRVVQSLAEVEGKAQTIESVFNGIVEQIKSLDEIVVEISAASKEQTQGIGEVNMAVGQMDKVTQSNAASAEENASAAEELHDQVRSLQGILNSLQSIVAGGSDSAIPAGTRPVHTTPTPAASQPLNLETPRSSGIARNTTPRKSKTTPHPRTAPAPGFSKVPRGGDIPMPEFGGSTGNSSTGNGGFQDF